MPDCKHHTTAVSLDALGLLKLIIVSNRKSKNKFDAQMRHEDTLVSAMHCLNSILCYVYLGRLLNMDVLHNYPSRHL